MKHEWRKKEKALYMPKSKPDIVSVPALRFVTIKGAGNPNSDVFPEYIGALYSISYAIKMNMKKAEVKPEGYADWTVYPLEGVWDITDEAQQNYNGTINKDDLVFELMIRQPDLVDEAFFDEMLEFCKKKKPSEYLKKVEFKTIEEGKCIQMLHIGSYDDEPESFAKMEAFAAEQSVKRKSKIHREIYLSDFRKVPAEKLKTTLRFQLANDE